MDGSGEEEQAVTVEGPSIHTIVLALGVPPDTEEEEDPGRRTVVDAEAPAEEITAEEGKCSGEGETLEAVAGLGSGERGELEAVAGAGERDGLGISLGEPRH